jgi:hypothetical protein
MLILLHFCILWDKLRRRYSKSWPTFFWVVNWVSSCLSFFLRWDQNWSAHDVYGFKSKLTENGGNWWGTKSLLQSLQLKVQDGDDGSYQKSELICKDTDSCLDRQNEQQPSSVEFSKKVPNGEVRTKWNWCGGNNKNVQPMNEDKVHILLVLTFFSSIEAKI